MDWFDETPAYHGGDLREAEALFGVPDAGWLDLSTGINPTAYPDTHVSPEAWHRLPQPTAQNLLLQAARSYYGVPQDAAIVAGPGSQALLQHLPALFTPGGVAVIGPTYAEHSRLWSASGHDVTTVDDLSKAKAGDIAVLVNPNNPDGRTVDPARLVAVDGEPRRRLLVVDEAFADTNPANSVVPRLGADPILALRSFGKFFGLPGLRLGFAIGPPGIVARLKDHLGPWAVSGAALEIGARALGDKTWIADTRSRLAERADALDRVLAAAHLKIVGGTSLFRLVEDSHAPEIFPRLGESGIFVRRFPQRPCWLRFGVPGTADDLQRLADALGTVTRPES